MASGKNTRNSKKRRRKKKSGNIALFVEKLTPRERSVFDRKITVLGIQLFIAAAHVVADKLRKGLLRKAREHDIGVLCSFLREHGRMHTAEENGLALFAEIIRKGIAARRGSRDAGDAH